METLQEKAEAFSPRSRGLPVSGSSDHLKTADHKAWDKEIKKLSDVVEQKIAAMNERSRRRASSSRSATDNGTARFQQTGAKSGSYCAPRRPVTVSPILNSTIASGSAIISSAPKAASSPVVAATASASSASPSGSRSVAATPSAVRPTASSGSSSTLPASKSSPTLVSSSSPLSSPISTRATPTTTAAPTSSPSSSISSPTSAVRTRISSNTTRVPTSVKSGAPTPTVPIASISRPHYTPSISTSLSTIPIRSPRKEEESNKNTNAKSKDTGFGSPPGQQAADKLLDPMTQTQLSTLLVKAGTHGYEIAQMLGQADLDLVQLNSQMREMVLKIKTATDLIVDPKLHEPKGQIMDACKELLVNAREFILCCKQTEVDSKDRAQKKLPVVATLTKIFDTLRQLSNAIGK